MGTISGSWEDLFERAVDAGATSEPETDALFDKLITRLNKLPDRVLMAGDGYLVGLRDRAVAEYARHLLDEDRASDALLLVDRPDHKMVDISTHGWQVLRAEVLSAAGMIEEAESAWIGIAADASDPDEFEESIMALIRLKRFASAAMLIRTLEQAASNTDEEDGYLPVSFFRTLLYANINRPAETEKSLQQFLKEDKEAVELVDEFIIAGWEAGFTPADVLRLTEVKGLPKALPLRILFWRVFALQQLGRADDAERAWRQLASDEVLHEVETKPGAIWMWAVAQYYLGDPKSMGLAATLDALREWGEEAPFSAYAAAAIGWTLQDDEKAANLNLALAVRSARKIGERSSKIPQPWRVLAQDLLTEEQFARIEDSFAEREIVEVQDIEL